jgi:methylthioribose-1-phosphate isomerase
VAVVQYTFTHKQYTEQHNETEYLERNIHDKKKTRDTCTKLNRSTQNIQQAYNKPYKTEPKEYGKSDKVVTDG